MRRRDFLSLAAAPAVSAASRSRHPNIVFMLSDDQGAWAMNAYGCRDLHTPNLDRLAAEGARFTRAFACTPVCSPSRVTYFTGRLPSHHGVQDWIVNDESAGPKSRAFLDGQPTFSEALSRSGYKVGLCGKWHMGDDERPQAGFTYWSTIPGGGGVYRDPTFFKNGQRVKRSGFKTDLIGDDALEFIEQNRAHPFLLYVGFHAPHTPYDYQPERDRAPYENSSFSCFPRDPVDRAHTKTMFGRPFPTLKDFNNRRSQLSYSALVTGMDHNVGRIMTRLKELGLDEDTLVIFTSDQGHCCGHHGIWGKGNSTVPINMYEPSLQVPLIWRHPGRIPPGQSLSPMVSSYDFFPTLLDYANVKAPADRKRPGRSYAGFLRGATPTWRNELFFEYEYVRAIRTENLKYVERTAEWPSELFDLEADPAERRNLINDPAHAGRLKTLRSRLSNFFNRAGAPPLQNWRATTKQDLPVYGGTANP